MFQDELASRGLPRAIEVSYEEVLANPDTLRTLPKEPLWIRLESVGENARVSEALLDLGYEEAARAGWPCISPSQACRPLPHGALYYPRQRHLGFLAMMAAIETAIASHWQWKLLSPVSAIADLFDKRVTSRRWRSLSIPTADALGDLQNFEELQAQVLAKGWRSSYVKISCSSSASGLAIYYPGPPPRIVTTVEQTPEGYFNSLKLRHYRGNTAITIVNMLLAEGAQVERAVPKAKMDGAVFDLRVVTIKGKAVFTVIRHSSHPITNLHLGGWRGDWATFRETIGEAPLGRIEESCEQVARAHPCHSLGIDVLLQPDWKTHLVLEANAFGDLLPRLTRKGRSVYGYQIDSLLGRV